MGYTENQKLVRAYRGQIPSPGGPSVAWREDRLKFWVAIARGVNPCLPTRMSGPYLSFAEREDIAIWHAQKISARELRRGASTRTNRLEYRATVAQWHAERRARRPKVASLSGTNG